METFFCTLKLKLWNVEISTVSCVIPRDFIPLSTFAPEALGALFIDYFVCHERTIKMDAIKIAASHQMSGQGSVGS